ncbi:MAG: hypothetical protein EXR75_09240 [Myxococcales bacterium]|nr:hypothetical protein [Myxococcales bacterium]
MKPRTGVDPPSTRTRLDRLADLQLRRPWLVLALAAILVALSLTLALRLRVQPGLEALLPRNRPSVLELDRVKAKTSGVSTVFILFEGDDTAALRSCADATVKATSALGHPWVGSSESGVHDALAFLEPRAGLFAKLEELETLHRDVLERYDYEVGKVTGASLDDDDDDDGDDDDGDDENRKSDAGKSDAGKSDAGKSDAAGKLANGATSGDSADHAPPKLDADSIKKRFGLTQLDGDRFPGGYYQSKDGKAVVVTIRSAVMGTDYEAGTEALRRIREAVEQVRPTAHHPSLRYSFSGDLVTAIAEYRAINDDLTAVGKLGATLLVTVVFLFYLRLRTLIAMLLTIAIGVAATFGATELLIGELNMATGFLFTIIAGNGINSGIIFMARYLELRRAGESLELAIRSAHNETWLPTLTAALAASAAYASLAVTEFRGFRDFGVIGCIGMALTWLCTYAFLPPLLVASERIAPLGDRPGLFGLIPKSLAGGARFGEPFAFLVDRAPRAATLAGVLLTILGAIATVGWVTGDPMEYDMRNLRSDLSARADEVRTRIKSEEITGHIGADGMAILVDRVEQVPWLTRALEQRRDSAPADAKPFKSVHSLQDFVPADQEKKSALVADIADRLVRAKKRGIVSDEDWNKLKRYLPPTKLAAYTMAELPEGVARPFTERDGTRGRIMFISPINSEVIDDAHYLLRWADAYRRTELPDGSVVVGSGRAVIYADIWSAVISDVPRAVVVSLVLTLFVVAVCFRAGFAAAAVMLSLLAGITWMTGLLALSGVKLNFLNFIALPITFGIGVDYAVNVMQRYVKEGPGSMLLAVRETGGAVVLCSMTTLLGYLALLGSVNYAVRGLGVAAVLGEVTCLIAAVVVLPGAILWRDRKRDAKAQADAANAAGLERAA